MKTAATARRGVAHRPACGHSFRRRREAVLARSAATRETIHSDYVVMGAGIIGLSCARALLQAEPEASVTVLEQAQPAFQAPSDDGAGSRLHLQNTTTATGAGQGCVLHSRMRCPEFKRLECVLVHVPLHPAHDCAGTSGWATGTPTMKLCGSLLPEEWRCGKLRLQA